MIRLMPRIRNIHMPANTPPASLQIGCTKLPLRNIIFVTQTSTQDGSTLNRRPHPRIQPLLPRVSMPWHPERGVRAAIRANLYTQTMRIRRGMPPNRRLTQTLHRLTNIADVMRRTTRRWGREIVCRGHSPSFTRGGRKPHIRACRMNHNPIHRTIRAGRMVRCWNKPHHTPPPNIINTRNTLPSSYYLWDDIVTIGDGFTPWQATEPDMVEATPSLYFTNRRPPEQYTDTTERPSRPSAPSLPSLPSDPFAPTGPRSPRSPCAPCGPAGPEGPTSPRSPAEPSRPSAPFTPSAPAGPATPLTPSLPLAPGNPSGPLTPFKPGEPCGPTGPTSPAEPLTPSLPSAPAGPCGPRSPAGPGTPCTLRSVRTASTHKPER